MRGGGAGRVGEERSSWVSHIHTLGVETGHKRVLKVARVSEELLGSGARRRLYKEGYTFHFKCALVSSVS